MIEKLNNSFITYYDNPPLHIREYYIYCLSYLKESLKLTDYPINLIFGNMESIIKEIPPIRIDIQCEHTLVKREGRSVNQVIFGKTTDEIGEKYLVRIDKFDYFNSLDYVIEYSYANYYHIFTSDLFNDYIKKNIVIEPIIFDTNFSKDSRHKIITLFTPNINQRRDYILNQLKTENIVIEEVSNCFDNFCLKNLYNKTKIMVNIHQTDHHHTLEELRILPALSQGVIIVSENVPLKETIPYSEYIIWSDYGNLAKTTKIVEENYEYYFKKIFNKKLQKILDNVLNDNKTKLLNLFI
jgi:hypothetical protein